MLKELYIENLAVIEKAVIPMSDKFNIFTGETGAGKSILIGGINAVLGQRVTKDIVRSGCKKAVVTGLFTDLNQSVIDRLDEMGISHDENEMTVTREISSDGGSSARINFKTASVSALKEIGELLVTIHGQHDNQILLAPERHINVLDSFGELEDKIEDYKNDFKKLQSLAKKLSGAKKARLEKRDRINYLKELIQELSVVDISPEEYSELEKEYMSIQNANRILKALSASSGLLENDEGDGILEMLSGCESEMSDVIEYSKDIEGLVERLTAARIELSDINDEIVRKLDSFDNDPERKEYVTGKYNTLVSLQKKHNCSYEQLLKLYENSKKELEDTEFSDDDLKKLSDEKDALLHIVTDKARELSACRKAAGEKFSCQVAEELKYLDMPDVVIQVKQDTGKLTSGGMDRIEFLISANKGEEPKPIAKIASGGELSRIMLALKSVIADKDSVDTMIFDEIDTGVSGRAAQKIGIKIRKISRKRQVICVTHLAQLAVMADNHLLIEKKTENDRTATSVTQLEMNGRIREIARIMGGENPSELILRSAEDEIKKAAEIC